MKHGNMVILIVDDDAEDIELFTQAVTEVDQSVTCIEAYNGIEALKVLKRNSWLPDYIFLDINMPLMNGRKCLEEIKMDNTYRKIPVIIYSTTSDKNQIADFKKLGADFFTKPDSYEVLKDYLTQLLKPAEIKKK
jgi:CheY-like chemotaxis protein